MFCKSTASVCACALFVLMPAYPRPVSSAAVPRAPQKPTLIVAIAVDQFSAGIFDQYRGRFKGGLRRMVDEGVVFPNGYQSPTLQPKPARDIPLC